MESLFEYSTNQRAQVYKELSTKLQGQLQQQKILIDIMTTVDEKRYEENVENKSYHQNVKEQA
jgi:hypothetical protein